MLKNLFLLSILTFLLFASVALPIEAIGVYTPFGGKITDKVSCICSLSTKIEVEGPVGSGTYMKTLTTSVYDHEKLETGRMVVGQAGAIPYICVKVVPTLLPPYVTCEEDGSGRIIDKIGTNN